MRESQQLLGTNYDPIAEEYAAELFHELDNKPLDRQWLEEFAERVGGLGPVCDMGCGPGQIARYLRDVGVEEVVGVDLSEEMVRVARQLSPDVEFRQDDMCALDIEDNALGGIAAFYCILHVPREEVVDVLEEWLRVLKPGGWLLLSFHIGDYVKHVDEFFEKVVNLDFVFFETEEMERCLRKAGFVAIESREREPYVGHEYESRRAYIFAQKGEE